MKLINLRSLPRYQLLEDKIRDSFIVELNDCCFTGRNIHYPNCLLQTETALVNPYDERVMSLKRDSFYDNDAWETPVYVVPDITETTPVYFFVYNVDNYFHFLYDTLPYLAGYFELQKSIPDLQLVLNSSHPSKQTLPPFVREMLNLLGVKWRFVDPTTQYKTVFLSTSLTHGQKSNAPPSKLAYTVWKRMVDSVNYEGETPKRFYISRRSWVHGKTENMGTNYTTRRCCKNEDEVVALLAQHGIQEVFTELLTTAEKIAYFRNAELVVGVVGGGMCNLLFSPESTVSLCINTPYFLDINQRFQYSMDHTRLSILECTDHVPSPGKFKLFSRVRVKSYHQYAGCYGEVEGFEEPSQVLVKLSSNDVAGFSQDFPMTKIFFEDDDLESVDDGLNSPYKCVIAGIERHLNDLSV